MTMPQFYDGLSVHTQSHDYPIVITANSHYENGTLENCTPEYKLLVWGDVGCTFLNGITIAGVIVSKIG